MACFNWKKQSKQRIFGLESLEQKRPLSADGIAPEAASVPPEEEAIVAVPRDTVEVDEIAALLSNRIEPSEASGAVPGICTPPLPEAQEGNAAIAARRARTPTKRRYSLSVSVAMVRA